MNSRMILLAVLVGCFHLGAFAENPRRSFGVNSTSTSGSGVTLGVWPSSGIVNVGMPMNLTCTFDTLPYTNNIFLSLTNALGTANIIQVSTVALAAAMGVDLQVRLRIYLLDDGVTLLFQYLYTRAADTGTYQCYVSSGASSNYVGVTVSGSGVTYAQPSVNVGLIVAVTIGVACVLICGVLLILRLKYRDRFFIKVCRRRQQPEAGAGAAGVSNPVYVVDGQLPQYNEAIRMEKAYLPPSYVDAVAQQQNAAAAAVPLPVPVAATPGPSAPSDPYSHAVDLEADGTYSSACP